MVLNKIQESLLKKLYYGDNSACQFAGADKVFRTAQRFDKNITNRDVDDFLSGQTAYTLHKKVVRRYQRLKTVPCGLHTDWQADLAQLDRISNENDGYPYILFCVDVLSRKIFVEPVKSKSSMDMEKSFNSIFKRTKLKPWKIFTDQGLEFNCRKMLKYFKDLDIIKLCAFTNPIIHAAIVERAIRTIKMRLFRYFTHYGTNRWVDIIQKIVKSANSSVNRTIECAPNAVTFENASRLWSHVYGVNQKKDLKKPKFSVGDRVRIEKQKGHFKKGYLPNFTDEIFKINEVHTERNPVVYRLVDLKGEATKGWFYSQDLCKTKQNEQTAYRIEKIIKERKSTGGKELFVKWLGYDNSYNCWIHESNIIVKK